MSFFLDLMSRLAPVGWWSLLLGFAALGFGCQECDCPGTDGDGDADSAAESDREDGDLDRDEEMETINGDADSAEELDGEDGDLADDDRDVMDGGDTDDETDVGDTEHEKIDPEILWEPIPPGSFQMGCSPGDGCSEWSQPVHLVTVPNFKMMKFEVTQKQYVLVMGNNPSHFQPPAHDSCLDCPVETVTWGEAKAFCEAVGWRLPSEAEWEYAARAGTTTRYYCWEDGNDGACRDRIAWYIGNSQGKTHPVGEKEPNVFGLYDMLGNVWEWTEDCWHENYDGAPEDGSAWVDKPSCARVVRGGDWLGGAAVYIRSFPQDWADGPPSNGLGFRCARDVE